MQLGIWTCCLCAQPGMNLRSLQVSLLHLCQQYCACVSRVKTFPNRSLCCGLCMCNRLKPSISQGPLRSTQTAYTDSLLPCKVVAHVMQDLAAGMAYKWQMELACPCLYGPSGQAPGGKSIMTPQRCVILQLCMHASMDCYSAPDQTINCLQAQ